MKLGKTAIICGTGAVEHSWIPILNVVRPFCKFHPPTIDSANSFFATIVYHLRTAAQINDEDALKTLLSFYSEVKASLSKEIGNSLAKSEITIRGEFIELTQLISRFASSYYSVTTNWDTAIDELFEETTHLHGVYSNPNALYLPTETIREPYRPDDEHDLFIDSHIAVGKAMIEAESLFIFGLAYSPLDAELSAVFSECFNGPCIQNIIVIDPDYDAVIKRLQFTFRAPNNNANLIGVHPAGICKLEKLLSHSASY